MTMKFYPSDQRLKIATFSLLLSELVRNLGMNFYSLSMPYYLASDKMAGGLADAPILIGVAIGVFGLVQASTQIPLGRLSDRIGRRGILIVSGFVYASGALMVGLCKTSISSYCFGLYRPQVLWCPSSKRVWVTSFRVKEGVQPWHGSR